jgi:hypothetical protein
MPREASVIRADIPARAEAAAAQKNCERRCDTQCGSRALFLTCRTPRSGNVRGWRIDSGDRRSALGSETTYYAREYEEGELKALSDAIPDLSSRLRLAARSIEIRWRDSPAKMILAPTVYLRATSGTGLVLDTPKPACPSIEE